MVERKCRICGATIWLKKSHAKKGWGKYCSKNCQGRSQVKGKWLDCDYCGKKIYRTPKDYKRSKSGKFFCTIACHCSWENKNKRCGENAPNWITGRSAYRQLLKRHGKPEKCRICGVGDNRVLVVHHIDTNRKNNKPENLEWLCRNCHCIIHLPS